MQEPFGTFRDIQEDASTGREYGGIQGNTGEYWGIQGNIVGNRLIKGNQEENVNIRNRYGRERTVDFYKLSY